MGDRYEVIMAGVGGQGVLTAGRLLAEVAVDAYQHVTLMSTYRAARRGGASECTTIFSRDEIASFILSKADSVVVMASSQLDTFAGRIRSGGLLIYEPSGLTESIERSDIRVFSLSAMEIAKKMGGIQAVNMVFLGTYIGLTESLPAESVVRKLEDTFRDKTLALNRAAFERGLEIGSSGLSQ